jgi:hypothetical protein
MRYILANKRYYLPESFIRKVLKFALKQLRFRVSKNSDGIFRSGVGSSANNSISVVFSPLFERYVDEIP